MIHLRTIRAGNLCPRIVRGLGQARYPADVTTRTRHYRTTTEVVGWRQQARTELAEWGPESEYVSLTRAHALNVFDWLLGDEPTGPATGEVREPDDRGISAELMAAEAREPEARAAGDRERAICLGRVHIVLSWFMRDPNVATPL